jgi:hypothetical protein
MKGLLFPIFLLVWCISPLCGFTQLREVMPGLLEKRGVAVLPPDIRNERTLVLVSAPAGTWQSVSEEVHPLFAAHAIDAVAYYQLEEVMAGPDAQKELLPLLTKRQFRQVAVIEATPEGKGELFLTNFSGDARLVDLEGTIWHQAFENWDALNNAFDVAFQNTSIAATNFLIPDFPEFFRAAGVPDDKRFERINPDIKLDNLAVRAFTGALETQNGSLTSIMQGYPFQWELVNAELSEEVIRRNGFQWILGYLRAPEANLKEILGYELNGAEGNKMVYKFYFRQLYAQEIYLGSSWDAHPDWQQALKNLIRQAESVR